MRAEEKRSESNVIAFRRPQEATDSVSARHAASEADRETQALPATVLNADRGIINTGTVHGGQHVTTIDLSAYSDDGADGDI